MQPTLDYDQLVNRELFDQDNEKIGKVDDIYLDDESGQPTWGIVRTGFFGNNVTFFPLERATQDDAGLHVPYSQGQIKDAPNVEADRELGVEEEDQLYAYYHGLGYTGNQQSDAPRDAPVQGADDGDAGHDTSGPNTDSAMTRSEEELQVDTEKVQTSKARLRKHVATQNVQKTVLVEKDVVTEQRNLDETVRREVIDTDEDTR